MKKLHGTEIQKVKQTVFLSRVMLPALRKGT